MAVPIAVVGGAAVVVLIIILIIVFIILRKRKKAALDAGERPAKGNYQKLESGELESEAVPEGENVDESGGKIKKKKRKKGAGKKGKSKRKQSQDSVASLEDEAGLGDSSVFTDDLAVPLISKLQFSVSYHSGNRQLLLYVHRGENFGVSSTTKFELRVTLLPAKRQRRKTRSQPSGNPVFNELLEFAEVDIDADTLRVRVYKLNERQRKLIGELRANLKADLSLDTVPKVEQIWRELTPVSDIPDDISDTMFVVDPESILAAPKETVPMLQISLQYRTITGKLTVEIIKARHMKIPNLQKAPEAFVEVSLLNSNGGEISCARTGACKGSFHPTFEETFYFPAIEFELSGLTLVVSVYYKKFRKKELIGWFGIGRQSTGEREQLHWDEMIDSRGEPIKGWYVLGQV
ncbi:synaptotagmin-14-like [Dendronephthya gigantea]|uniref:synaptotagmin-14-like n=1 Tax=Dendronephthya gigantea TaxID=151771 RepID=UPI00106CA347|nr:synaptotagmin-14-like [Dendronephthya gigantea]